MKKVICFGAVLSALALLAPPATAGATCCEIVVKPYIGVIGDLTILCAPVEAPPSPDQLASIGIGGNCFQVPPNAVIATPYADDELNGGNTGIQSAFYDASGTQLTEFVSGCQGPTSVGVPAGAAVLKVFVDFVLNGPSDCHTELPGGIGIQGRIFVSWTIDT